MSKTSFKTNLILKHHKIFKSSGHGKILQSSCKYTLYVYSCMQSQESAQISHLRRISKATQERQNGAEGHTYSNTCSHISKRKHKTTWTKKQRKSSRQGHLTQGRDCRLFIHHLGGSKRTNTTSNTGKCDSGVWDVEVYKVQHNRHLNWATETFLIVCVGEEDTNQTLCPGCCPEEWRVTG